ncbi:DNA polymerase III subunit gamma and tau [Cellulomonas sp. Sa3CUA2]|uniref:DNA-directed DNA polymerase n=1 Tax=Cellulomonas avistercoris TaxID=2762242 RepID=A0ABR8QHS4_9CELL|nr:DNA polymerase III subunit gamma and tau [Cellulomonas avistercoris]MBD7919964.1 DNA polymerase III subunit gamma and tau [Cellulomonas avistercoris]
MSTALYRRYRPESFAEVIGQDHVTAPLRQALRSGQANHAYLFSGPRGCGKTTSARILARCLNCAEGPTDTPCGVCPSCVELARGGSGSLDVVEIDAASHGGVDDARELRERATFAPARDRYKVFILDEAHMVSPQGFNALLKIVEEPPPHVKFIFATTEPDKVIGTIRSRTHHYPFRLVPPDVLVPYLEQLCATEGVPVGPGVLPLVVRSGGGSVRDTLSVLDQLIAGSGDEGLVYEGAVALLGYTHTSLLDDLVDAIAARDGASAFRVVERVVATGHEPRRFVEDLLERLRDLIVLSASGDAADAVLRDVPADQLDRMRRQSTHLGASELSRSADLANAALTEMVGATSPRLHLELLMARLLLPSVDDSRTGLGARIDRLERGFAAGGGAAPAAPVAQVAPDHAAPAAAPAPPARAAEPADARVAPGTAGAPAAAEVRAPSTAPAGSGAQGRPASDAGSDVGSRRDAPRVDPPAPAVAATVSPSAAPTAPVASQAAAPAAPQRPAAPAAQQAAAPAAQPAAASAAQAAAAPAAQPAAAPAAQPAAPAPGAVAAAADTEMLRRRWPDVLTTLRRLRLPSWALVNQHAQVLELDATTLRLGFAQPGLVTTFRNSNHAEVVARALSETLGVTARVEGVLDEPGGASVRPAAPSAADAPSAPGAMSREQAAASWDEPSHPAPREAGSAAADRRSGGRNADEQHGDDQRRRTQGARDRNGSDEHGAADRGRSTAATGDAATSGTPAPAQGTASGSSDPGASARGGAPGVDAPGRPTPPWEPDDTATGPQGAPGAAAGASSTASAGPPVVAHPDDDIPPGDEPEDPWGAGSAPARRSQPGTGGRPGGPAAQGDPRPATGRTAPGRPAEAGRPSTSPTGGTARERGVAAARAAAAQSRHRSAEPDEPSPDDPTIGQSGLIGVPLVAQVLGGRVIDEQIDI